MHPDDLGLLIKMRLHAKQDYIIPGTRVKFVAAALQGSCLKSNQQEAKYDNTIYCYISIYLRVIIHKNSMHINRHKFVTVYILGRIGASQTLWKLFHCRVMLPPMHKNCLSGDLWDNFPEPKEISTP